MLLCPWGIVLPFVRLLVAECVHVCVLVSDCVCEWKREHWLGPLKGKPVILLRNCKILIRLESFSRTCFCQLYRVCETEAFCLLLFILFSFAYIYIFRIFLKLVWRFTGELMRKSESGQTELELTLVKNNVFIYTCKANHFLAPFRTISLLLLDWFGLSVDLMTTSIRGTS